MPLANMRCVNSPGPAGRNPFSVPSCARMAAETAIDPCAWISRTSSPVLERGPLMAKKERLVKRRTVSIDKTGDGKPSRRRRIASKCRRRISNARAPLIRITATADRPGGVACAKMVSAESRMVLLFPSKVI